ncbi:MAG: hypothetical protein RIR70_676 [Pseudomonadota bacterium]
MNKFESKLSDSIVPAWLRGLVLLALALALGGCATVEYRDTKAKSANDGALLVRVLPNVQSSSQYFKNWHALKVARAPQAGEPKEVEYSVRAKKDAASRSAVYAGMLPPGQYRFVQFSSEMCGNGCVSSWLNIDEKFSRFEIKPGQITDLGVLVQTGSQDGSQRTALTHDLLGESELTPQIVREIFPDLLPMMSKPRLSWDEASIPAFMGSTHRAAVQLSYGFLDAQDIGDGALLYGSANGAVGRWKLGGARKLFDIGERVSVDSVLVLSESQWMAAGEFSTVRITNDRGRTWQSLSGNLPLGLIVSLNLWRESVFLTLLQGKDVKIYRAPVGSDQWQLLASHTTDVNLLFDLQGVLPQSQLYGDVLFTTVPARQLSALDLTSGHVEMRTLPVSANNFAISADGVLRCHKPAAFQTHMYESNDLGKTWVESNLPRSRLPRIPAFRDKQHGVVVSLKWGQPPFKFAYTSDGGKTWVETTEPPHYFDRLFYSRDGSKAFASTVEGKLWQTEDDGKTWLPIK